MAPGMAPKLADNMRSDTEFTIYTFQAGQHPDCACQWHRHESTADMGQALGVAQTLYDTGKYSRIEVRRRHFDDRACRMTDTVLKNYQDAGLVGFNTMTILMFAFLCGITAFAVIGWLV